MPNTFAYIVLFSWPLVVFVLFRTLPLQKALIWSIVAGYLLLPQRTGINIPMVPAINRDLIPSLTAAVMCFVVLRRQALDAALGRAAAAVPVPPAPPAQGPERFVLGGLLLLLLTSPFITVLQNGEPLVFGPRVVTGLRPYDAFSIVGATLIMILPFLLAQRFLATDRAHRLVLLLFVVAMLGYSLLALWEVRMSPQLNRQLYGFFPHSFGQHMRGGGFRPVVFLNHGLWLGVLLSMAVVAACALWRQALRDRIAATPWLFAAGWLLVTLVLSRNLGATALAMLAAPLVLFTPVRVQILVAAVVAGAVLLFPMLRGAGWVPMDRIVEISARVDTERADSLAFRIRHEDALLARANEKPLGGWGSWGRNRIFDADTGRDLSTTDGYWVMMVGAFGWLGYIARFGLLAGPILLLALRRHTATPATAGLALVLTVALLDLIPNATISPITWLVAGALAGHCLRARAGDPAAQSAPAAPALRWQSLHPGGPLRPLPVGPDSTATAAASGPTGWTHQRRPRG